MQPKQAILVLVVVLFAYLFHRFRELQDASIRFCTRQGCSSCL